MENTRANYLVDKCELSEEDKNFLKKHLELYQDVLYSRELEIMRLKDVIDYNKCLDNDLLSVKEQIIKAFSKDMDKKEMLDKVNSIINKLANT